MSGPAALRLSGVRKSFGAVAALKGVDLEVRAGEVHALLGENGAGKSTLMAIAAGALAPDAGRVEIGGAGLSAVSPRAAQALGLTVVYQHPAVVDDLSVTENLVLAMPPDRRPSAARATAWAADVLAAVEAGVDPGARGADLTPAQRQLVEIAKALATDPKVLILDEPTAALSAAEVERLFARVRAIRDRGTAVVYISHRIPEVTAIADRLTVLRDGEQRGTFPAKGVSEEAIVSLILGREFAAAFPDKGTADRAAPVALEVRDLAGPGFDDVALEVRAGEIYGLAGAEGNGQREALRALAGLEPSRGTVRVRGSVADLTSPAHAQRSGVHLVPGDRPREGLLTALSVRENAAISSLAGSVRGGFVMRGHEDERVGAALAAVDVRAASPETDVAALSGGNQQKVVLARALLAEPEVLLCDEPTQGVDAGARLEIYKLLRRLAAEGKAVVVLSSDVVELEGLCDRVAIFSRGHVIAVLDGDEVTEERITGTAIRSTQARRAAADGAGAAAPRGAAVRRLLRGDRAAVPILLAAIALLALWTAGSDDAFLGAVNLESLLLLTAALALVSLGQLTVLLTAGIDLSVGPLMALTVVVLSFHAEEGAGGGGIATGLVLVVLVGVAVGLVNGLLVRAARISPIIATLATFIVLQGVAQLLRPEPGGVLAVGFADAVQASIGWLPVAFLAAAALALLAEGVLRRRPFGLAVRAAGSDEAAAHRIGVPVGRTVVAAYVTCSLFAVLGGVVLAGVVGIGDASVGSTYTLSSVTAVVLGAASIYGGRGSFVATLLGALLVSEIINATSFLGMEQAWQYWLPGGLILAAAALFARTRTVAGRMRAA